ncbi:MAG TPA: hypothetical protein VFG55_00660 [Rhodanobacteraceae bacterium]|nr:hypothetical protein [Rhodanobacteraceae bacterium]
MASGECLADAARRCLDAGQVDEKLALTRRVAAAFAAGDLELATGSPPLPIGVPGRPQRPRLIAPRDLPRRGLGTAKGPFNTEARLRAGFSLAELARIEEAARGARDGSPAPATGAGSDRRSALAGEPTP